MEANDARLSVMIPATAKRDFEQLCRDNDILPSQAVRGLIRDCLQRDSPLPAEAQKPPGSRTGKARAR